MFKALFSTSQVWDSTRTILQHYFFPVFYLVFGTCLHPVLLFRFLQTEENRTQKPDEPAGIQWCQSTLAREDKNWALSTVQRATDGQSKNKRRLNGLKNKMRLSIGQNLQDWFILGLNYTNWTNETIASLAFWNESGAVWSVTCSQIVTG